MSYDWEGNRRSDVTLAMRHRLEWFIHLRAQGLSKGDEHPTNTLHGAWYSLPFYNQENHSTDLILPSSAKRFFREGTVVIFQHAVIHRLSRHTQNSTYRRLIAQRREVVQKDCQPCNLNKEDAVDRGRRKKLIKIG